MANETLVIETPEHVELQFSLVTLGNRFLACAIDHGIQLIVIVVLFILAQTVNSTISTFNRELFDKITAGNLWVIAMLIIAIFVIFFGYFTFFEIIWNGQTPGKRLLKLRVIKDDGRPITAFESFSRNLIRLADSFPTPYYSVGMIAVFTNPQSKRLGDMVAGTLVIKEDATTIPTFVNVFETNDENDKGFDVARKRVAQPVQFSGDHRVISSAEISVVETFLRRRFELSQLPRQWLAWRIAMPILEKIRPTFDRDLFSYEGFLEELLARYYRS